LIRHSCAETCKARQITGDWIASNGMKKEHNAGVLENFIDEDLIWSDIARAEQADAATIRDIIAKAEEKNGLSPYEAAVLLKNKDKALDAELFAAACRIKKGIYGNRMVVFAPLYVSNKCQNQCLYCGFNAKNEELKRKTLNPEELQKEVEILEDLWQKRLLLVYGEHSSLGPDWIAETMKTVYKTTSEKSGEIRRVNINCAPLTVSGFKMLKDVGIGTYQCFQETYHKETYEQVHISGKKADFLWRLYANHRAQEAGIDDVSIGALFGLFDPTFDVLGLLYHALQLEKDWGVGPHTISFQRIEPALGSEISKHPLVDISQHDFKKIVAVLRMAVPYTGLILTTRETAEFRKELIEVGVSQMSGGSRTYPGAYQDTEYDRPELQQFCLGDSRSLDDTIYSLITEHGYIPSWCTACYRAGRTGDHFMELAKKGMIQKFCQPNAILTFKEYLLDYASEKTREAGNALIEKEVAKAEGKKRDSIIEKLARIEKGERDLYI